MLRIENREFLESKINKEWVIDLKLSKILNRYFFLEDNISG